MTKDELKEHITQHKPGAVYEETGEWLNVYVEAGEWKAFAHWLRNEALQMDYLFCLTCIDWSQTACRKNLVHYGVSFYFTTYRHNLVVKVKLDRNNAEIETVSDIWRTAEFHEREVYDLFGVMIPASS